MWKLELRVLAVVDAGLELGGAAPGTELDELLEAIGESASLKHVYPPSLQAGRAQAQRWQHAASTGVLPANRFAEAGREAGRGARAE